MNCVTALLPMKSACFSGFGDLAPPYQGEAKDVEVTTITPDQETIYLPRKAPEFLAKCPFLKRNSP